jgi:hypothetical protein
MLGMAEYIWRQSRTSTHNKERINGLIDFNSTYLDKVIDRDTKIDKLKEKLAIKSRTLKCAEEDMERILKRYKTLKKAFKTVQANETRLINDGIEREKELDKLTERLSSANISLENKKAFYESSLKSARIQLKQHTEALANVK